ncbi:MAG: right-handed parallel beta-helix repeat-containing protein [Spirochaetales bacterium]|nr:right-handed parallel beta-helix repeat-containing protein [Spirochaetales bacterium]
MDKRITILIWSTILSASLLLQTSCDALRRSDLAKAIRETTALSRIGFAAADNPRLARDVFIHQVPVDGTLSIPIPYYEADGTTPLIPGGTTPNGPLIITFEPIGENISVLLDGTVIESGEAVSFHNGGPQERTFTITRSLPDRDGIVESHTINVNLYKVIRPVILNPDQTGVLANPSIDLELALVDENNNPIPLSSAADALTQTDIGYDNQFLSWVTGPAPNVPAPPHHYNIALTPLLSREYAFNIPENVFLDSGNYGNLGASLTFEYMPPPIYLSQSGRDFTDEAGTIPNTGTLASDPLQSWGAALGQVNATRSDIFISASETPYDVDGFETIDGNTIPRIGIYGGYNEDFTAQSTGDWSTRATTTFIDSNIATPVATGSADDPRAVLRFQNLPNTSILSGVRVQAPENESFTAAIRLLAASPRIHDSFFVAPTGSSIGSVGISVQSGSTLSAIESFVQGRIGGTGESTGVLVRAATASFENCIISGGDINDTTSGSTLGIRAQDSTITIGASQIISGADIFGNTLYQESANTGVFLTNSSFNAVESWVHALPSRANSIGIDASVTAGSSTFEINASNIRSETSRDVVGIRHRNTSLGNFSLFNSSVYAADGTGTGTSALQLEGAFVTRVMNNAITTGRSAVVNQAIGIEILNSNGNEQIFNNLIWSSTEDDFSALRGIGGANISNISFRNNMVWDRNGPPIINLNGGNGDEDLYTVQNRQLRIVGNLVQSASIDTNISYAIDDFEMGRAENPSQDLIFGGEDLSAIPNFPEVTPGGDNSDMDNHSRTSFTGIGWSLGPFEFDGTAPDIIFVSLPSQGGNDEHPLGTQEAPLASVIGAYNRSRGVASRTDVREIRVSAGIYDLGASAGTIRFNDAQSIHVLGGYDPITWVRNPAASFTQLSHPTGTVISFENGAITNDFLLEGFSIATNFSIAIDVSNGAAPRIEMNLIAGGDVAPNSHAILAQNSSPTIINNVIDGGEGSTTSIGVEYRNATGGVFARNTIYGGRGGNTIQAIKIDNSSGVQIRNNVIHGGNSPAGNTVGVFNSWGNASIIFANNTIYGGNGGGSTTVYETANTAESQLVNNIFISGQAGTTNHIIKETANTQPTLFQNNFLLSGPGATGIPYENTARTQTFSNLVDLEAGLTAAGTSPVSGNILNTTNALGTFFVDFSTGPSLTPFLQEDWSLSGSTVENAHEGGLDLSTQFTDDRNGTTRSVPWSIGAYEF